MQTLYGIPPATYRAPAATHVGAVKLAVANINTSANFYTDILGFLKRPLPDGSIALHAAGADSPLIVLKQIDGNASPTPRSHLGLYHYAILLPDRPALGRALRQLRARGVRTAASDHDVSEALYISDPDGLGIEIYADRPRHLWKAGPAGLDAHREIYMTTEPADTASLLSEAGDAAWDGMPDGTRMGHVHLHVGELTEAARFYADGLGLDRMVIGYPGALFLAAGGYHHHVGLNTWAGRGAESPREDQPRLMEWTLVVPAESDVQGIIANLATLGYGAVDTGEGQTADAGPHSATDSGEVHDTGTLIPDPWGTAVRVRAAHVSESAP